MFLGIEIGGTKLQLGVGEPGKPLRVLERRTIDADRGAQGILDQIREVGRPLVSGHAVQKIGIGFGGPVSSSTGRVVTSHQISGWDDFPLRRWCQEHLGAETLLGNDCDAAALAEARVGAGAGLDPVFFLTVGTGIGGGFVSRNELLGRGRPAVAEIGHLRPWPDRTATVESIAAGPGVSARFAERGGAEATAKEIGERALKGEALAAEVLREGCEVLGWAIAQMITLVAPRVVVIGGGVSLIGEQYFFQPTAAAIDKFVFPPLRGSYQLKPAELGEEVVVHGAILFCE